MRTQMSGSVITAIIIKLYALCLWPKVYNTNEDKNMSTNVMIYLNTEFTKFQVIIRFP